jgi:hypothetical protein
MMAEQPKAQGISGRFTGGVPDTPPVEPPTLASQGIDKNLAHRAMTSKRVDADFRGYGPHLPRLRHA